jgi:hypothetical protein
MHGDECLFDALDFHHLEQQGREVHTSSGCSDSAFILGKYGLEVFHILWFCWTLDEFLGQWSLTKREQCMLELLVSTIKEEAQGASTAGGIVDDLSYHAIVFAKVEFVADTNLTSGVNQYVPQTHIAIKFSKQENLDSGTSLFLITIEAGGENLGVVEDKHILLVKEVYDVSEGLAMFDDSTLGVNYHKTTIIAMVEGALLGEVEIAWILSNALIGQSVLEL